MFSLKPAQKMPDSVNRLDITSIAFVFQRISFARIEWGENAPATVMDKDSYVITWAVRLDYYDLELSP